MDKSRPEKLLEVVNKQDSNRGHLRVFLGMCPGVGKTYSMLEAAREQQKRGKKVIVACVETHGRIETQQLLQGLEVLPSKTLIYKDTKLAAMDIDRVIELRPEIVLVDELAHTNAPGARHNKRYQDVEEILDHGIDVYTTVNIQHIESRKDQVAQITGVIVRESVPDSFFENADQIEIVDIAPNELLGRLEEGKIYLGEGRADWAAQNFFKEEYLTALREIALRFTAEHVDQDLHAQMLIKGIQGPWNTNERLLVAVSHNPNAGALIRAARRMAFNLEAPWLVLHIDLGKERSEAEALALRNNLALARELGAEIVTVTDSNLLQAIQKIAIEKNVTQIVMGRPKSRFLLDLFRGGTLLDLLIQSMQGVDMHVMRLEHSPATAFWKLPNFRSSWTAYYNTACFIMALSLVAYWLLPYFGYKALGSLFLLGILVVSSLSSRGPIIMAALASALIWDYCFIPPRFTFIIREHGDIMMLFSFLITAIVGGYLTNKIRKQEELMQGREEKTRLLYELGKMLSLSKSEDEVSQVLVSAVQNRFEATAIVLVLNNEGRLSRDLNSQRLADKDWAVAQWVAEHGQAAGWSTETLSASRALCMPIKVAARTIGVLVYYANNKKQFLSMEQQLFLETVIDHVALALEGHRLTKQARVTELYEVSEKLHQTLINSVSHELRTPITAIIAAATALKDQKSSNETLVQDLIKSARRLDRVVENLLDMSRIENGVLTLQQEWFQVSELVKDLEAYQREEAPSRQLIIKGDLDLYIRADYKLLRHALANILLNAIKYSETSSPIDLELLKREAALVIIIKDRGPGIPVGSEEKIFEKFYRVPGTASGGLGLGLSIVKSIIEAHAGTIHASTRLDANSGAEFRIELPLVAVPKELTEIVK